MTHTYADPVREFEAAEAAAESSRAAALSRQEGKRVDANGFTVRPNLAAIARRQEVDSDPEVQARRRETRLNIARWTAEAKAQAAAERERELMEFRVPTIDAMATVAEKWPEVWAKMGR